MIFLRGLWRQKPKQWGPANVVNSIINDRLSNWFGVDNTRVNLAILAWGPGNQRSYGDKNATGELSSGAVFEKNSLNLVSTPSTLTYPTNDSFYIPDGEFTVIINAATLPYGSALGTKAISGLDNSSYNYFNLYKYSTNRIIIGGRLHQIGLADSTSTLYFDSELDRDRQKTFIFTYNKDAGYFRGYIGKTKAHEVTGTYIDFPMTSTNPFIIKNIGLSYAIVIHKTITENVINRIVDNPYEFIQPPAFRTYFIPSGDSTPTVISLAGEVAAVGVVNGIVSKDISLSGAVTCVGAASGTPTIDTPGVIALSGSVQGVGLSTGVVSKDISLSGAASGDVDITGSASVDVALTGSVSAQCAASGTITITEALLGDTMATYNNPAKFTVTAAGTVVITADTADAKVMITKSLHKMPYIKTEALAVAIPENNASTNRGVKAEYSKMPQLLSALYGTDGTDAQGKLTLTWQPMFNAAEVTGTVNILTTDDGTTNTLHYDADNNLLELTDGTNTSIIACTPVADTAYNIVGNWDEVGGLQISLDSVDGSLVSFAGSFPIEDEMSFAWEADAPQYIKIVSIEKES